MTRRTFLANLVVYSALRAERMPFPRLVALPAGGVQPDLARDAEGRLHAVYLLPRGADGCDVFYVTDRGGGAWTDPIRVNSRPNSAIERGTIRGAQLALGRGGRPHVLWNGHGQAHPPPPTPTGTDPATVKFRSPVLYARLDEAGKGFEPQRNLMTRSYALDGGASVAADGAGRVHAIWHASIDGGHGEEGRRVWAARSIDDGASFAPEEAVFGEREAACACCGLRAFADSRGRVHALYRSARQIVHRDTYYLRSEDGGASFFGKLLHAWEIGACPMSSMGIVEAAGEAWGSWETAGQVYSAHLDVESLAPAAAPGETGQRKHPRLAIDDAGRRLLTWAEGTGWNKAGTLGWALVDPAGRLVESGGGEALPAWSFAAPAALPGGGFRIVL